MSENASFRRIRESRADDQLRLVHADQLQAAGDPLGEFIAVQCELHRLGLGRRSPSWDWIGEALVDFEAIDPKRLRTLRAREKALLEEHEKAWVGNALKIASKVTFERGFVARAEVDAGRLEVGDVAKLFDAAPMLEALDVHRVEGEFLKACFTPADQLHELVMAAVGASALAREPGTSLKKLHLRGEPSMGHGALEQQGLDELLARWSGLGALEHLTLTQLDIGPERLATILRVTGALQHLDLRQNELGPAGADLLAASPRAAALRILSLLGNALGPRGVTSLAKTPALQGLQGLDLRKNKLGVDGARAVGGAFPNLRVLDLTGNSLGTAGLEALVGGSGLGGLRDLCLQQTSLDDAALAALVESPLLGHLRLLNLRSNKLTDKGAKVLAKAKNAKALVQVNLNNNDVSAAGKKLLSESEYLPNARILA